MAERGAESERPAGDGSGGEVVQGTIERVTYADPDSRYSVLQVRPERGFTDDETLFMSLAGRVTAVGRADAPAEGQRVRLLGRWTRHAVHGRQFAFDVLEELVPIDRDGLVKYLSSPAFRGIGPTLAARIVDALGPSALRILREEPERLAGVRGLRGPVRDELVATIRSRLGTQELIAFLLGAGLGPWQAEAAARELGADAEAAIRADPWSLSRVPGIGFRTADKVGLALGCPEDALERRAAALSFALERAADDGHVLQRRDALFERAVELLGDTVAAAAFEEALERQAGAGHVVVEDERVYTPALHRAEVGLAEGLSALARAPACLPLADAARLRKAEQHARIELHEDQRTAVLGLLAAPVALLTGGPGVGKTTLVRLVVELAEASGARVRLASPTGRAAKRLSEATGRDASTIHRLLGFQPGTRRFEHGPGNTLEADLVVVDELSMVDLALAHALVRALEPPTRLVLVGDPDQLPAVAAGNVLADLLACGGLPVFRLTRIFRQREGSRIVASAHRILAGETPEPASSSDAGADFFFFPADDEEATAERLLEVVTERIPRRFDMRWIEDVQVLVPMYRGPCGVDMLNERLREAHASGGREIVFRGRVWREGDRVIHTRNDYEKGVFNGDLGRLVRVNDDGSGALVRFPEREVAYTPNELRDLAPAFAMTVHRSQGGEFPAVVMPLVTQHWAMLQRNLLYTAVTRAQRLLVLVGSQRALETAVARVDASARDSHLAERLRASSDG